MGTACNLKNYSIRKVRGGWDRQSFTGLVILLASMSVFGLFSAGLFIWADETEAGGEPVSSRRRARAAPKPAPASEGSIPAPAALPRRSIEAVNSKDPLTRLAAIRALGERGPEAKEAVPALVAALKDKDVNIRASSAEALGAIRPYAKEVHLEIARLLEDEYHYCRLAAAGALWEIQVPTDAAASVIFDALRLEFREGVRMDLARVMSSDPHDGSLSVTELISNPEGYRRDQAVALLLSFKDKRKAVLALIRILKAELRP